MNVKEQQKLIIKLLINSLINAHDREGSLFYNGAGCLVVKPKKGSVIISCTLSKYEEIQFLYGGRIEIIGPTDYKIIGGLVAISEDMLNELDKLNK